MFGGSSATTTMSTGAHNYNGCKMATQLKKTFRVFKLYSRKSMSALQRVLRKSYIFELNAFWNSVVKCRKCVARKGNVLMCAVPANEQHQTPLLHQNNFFKFLFQLYNSLFMGAVCFLKYIL
jgi:hypothetical protein